MTLFWKPVDEVVPAFQLSQWFLDTLGNTDGMEIPQPLTCTTDAYAKR